MHQARMYQKPVHTSVLTKITRVGKPFTIFLILVCGLQSHPILDTLENPYHRSHTLVCDWKSYPTSDRLERLCRSGRLVLTGLSCFLQRNENGASPAWLLHAYVTTSKLQDGGQPWNRGGDVIQAPSKVRSPSGHVFRLCSFLCYRQVKDVTFFLIFNLKFKLVLEAPRRSSPFFSGYYVRPSVMYLSLFVCRESTLETSIKLSTLGLRSSGRFPLVYRIFLGFDPTSIASTASF